MYNVRVNMTDKLDVSNPTSYIFRPYRICPKSGEKLWAKAYGKKAWKIPVLEPKISKGDDGNNY